MHRQALRALGHLGGELVTSVGGHQGVIVPTETVLRSASMGTSLLISMLLLTA